jgi:hypothetical protein
MNGNYIVKSNLKISSHDQSLPIIQMMLKLDNRLKGGEEKNLADVFEYLFKPPFGFYKCHIFLAATGFLLRKYRKKLYNVSTGELITNNVLKTMIEQIFLYHCDKKRGLRKSLAVRMGSKDEQNLVKLIQEIFVLNDCHSLIDTRHLLHSWIKDNLGFPLWLFKNSDIDDVDVIIALQTINDKFLDNSSENQNISLADIKNIYSEIEPLKLELKQLISSVTDDSKKEYFLSFFDQMEAVNIEDSDYKNIMLYLEENLQEDIVFWSPEKIREKVQVIIQQIIVERFHKRTTTIILIGLLKLKKKSMIIQVTLNKSFIS